MNLITPAVPAPSSFDLGLDGALAITAAQLRFMLEAAYAIRNEHDVLSRPVEKRVSNEQQ